MDTERVHHEILKQHNITEEEEQEKNRLCKSTSQSNRMTEKYFGTGDLPAGSFSVVTVIQF